MQFYLHALKYPTPEKRSCISPSSACCDQGCWNFSDGQDCLCAGVAPQGVDGLLPQPSEPSSHARGLLQQPQLAHLLRYVLCNSSRGVNTAIRWATSFRRSFTSYCCAASRSIA